MNNVHEMSFVLWGRKSKHYVFVSKINNLCLVIFNYVYLVIKFYMKLFCLFYCIIRYIINISSWNKINERQFQYFSI